MCVCVCCGGCCGAVRTAAVTRAERPGLYWCPLFSFGRPLFLALSLSLSCSRRSSHVPDYTLHLPRDPERRKMTEPPLQTPVSPSHVSPISQLTPARAPRPPSPPRSRLQQGQAPHCHRHWPHEAPARRQPALQERLPGGRPRTLPVCCSPPSRKGRADGVSRTERLQLLTHALFFRLFPNRSPRRRVACLPPRPQRLRKRIFVF